MLRHVPEGHIVQHHFAAHGTVRGRHGHRVRAVRLLRLLIHDREHPLRTGKCREDVGHLHGNIVDREGELARSVAERRQSADIEAGGQAQDAAHPRRDGVGDVGGVVHNGAHNAAVELRAELLLAHIVIE